jgi:hypothetical protein
LFGQLRRSYLTCLLGLNQANKASKPCLLVIQKQAEFRDLAAKQPVQVQAVRQLDEGRSAS